MECGLEHVAFHLRNVGPSEPHRTILERLRFDPTQEILDGHRSETTNDIIPGRNGELSVADGLSHPTNVRPHYWGA